MLDVTVTRTLHSQRFGQDSAIFVAPGRVNLIGEHTDYAEGFVMPAAIDFATLAAICPRDDRNVAIFSANFDNQVTYPLDSLPGKASHHWSDYPLGVVFSPARSRRRDTRLQPHAQRRCAAGRGTQFLGLDRSGQHGCHPEPDQREVHSTGSGQALPARGKSLRRRLHRHHGSVHRVLRRRRSRSAARLPKPRVPPGADSSSI